MSAFKKILFSFLFIVVSGASNASLVTVDGSNVSFTFDDSLVSLFGAATVSGDTLSFVPVSFIASKEGSTGTVYTSDSFKVTIASLFGDSISNIALTELGGYTKEGPTANVIAKGTLTTNDLTNNLASITTFKADVVPFPETSFEGEAGTWAAHSNVNFTDSFLVEALLFNKLGARSGSLDDIAFINKTFVGLTATTVAAVPLPQAVWLFGAGLMGLLSVSKRKKLL